MSKSKSNGIILAEGEATVRLTGVDAARVAADAMLRAAVECCYQHDRYARLVTRPALEAEHRAADATCTVVAGALAQMAETYGEAARELRPNGGSDEEWWHRANALWHASREFVRREMCVRPPAKQSGKHDSDALGDLVLQYDLQASALLALRQAAEAYRKMRPEAS